MTYSEQVITAEEAMLSGGEVERNISLQYAAMSNLIRQKEGRAAFLKSLMDNNSVLMDVKVLALRMALGIYGMKNDPEVRAILVDMGKIIIG